MNTPSRTQYLKRGIRNRCPACGVGNILQTVFVRHEHCPHCGMKYDREDGFFSGAMAINYALVCALYLFPLLLVWWWGWLSGRTVIILSFLGAAAMPILNYRYSQCLWLGLYYFLVGEDNDRPEGK